MRAPCARGARARGAPWHSEAPAKITRLNAKMKIYAIKKRESAAAATATQVGGRLGGFLSQVRDKGNVYVWGGGGGGRCASTQQRYEDATGIAIPPPFRHGNGSKKQLPLLSSLFLLSPEMVRGDRGEGGR